MLDNLRIQHLAIIEDCDLNFESGFTVITGESGAGKSIIVDAIELLSGKQANDEFIHHDHESAFVEASFTIPHAQQAQLFHPYADDEDQIIVSRKLRRGKPSQARINGQTVPIKVLKDIVPLCLQLTSQHDTHQLFDPRFQLQLFDEFCGTEMQALQAQYSAERHDYLNTKQQLESGHGSLDERDQKLEFLSFQIDDIKQHHFKANEDQELQDQRRHLQTSKDQKNLIDSLQYKSRQLMDDAQQVLIDVEKLAELNQEATPMYEQFKTLSLELEDMARATQQFRSDMDLGGPGDLSDIEHRLDTIFKVTTKYKVNSIDALLTLLGSLENEKQALEDAEATVSRLKAELEQKAIKCQGLAQEIRKLRHARKDLFCTTIMSEMTDLHFLAHQFACEFEPQESFGERGQDKLTFMVSTNPGQPLKPLHKVASGGELSRMMLALKVNQRVSKAAPTLVFDEIDTGIGGITATSMGEKLQTIAKHQQLICITHLAQIASCADHHVTVVKQVHLQATQVQLKTLAKEDVSAELQRMQGRVN